MVCNMLPGEKKHVQESIQNSLNVFFILRLFASLFLVMLLSSCSLFISNDSSRHEGDFYGLIIGVDEYNSFDVLNVAVQDASSVSILLKEYDYETALLTNSGATKAAIIDELDKYAQIAAEKDTFLFYFAGHGGYGPDFGYDENFILPCDESSIEVIQITELLQKLSEIPGKKIVLLDACNSGGFVNTINETTADTDTLPQEYPSSVLNNYFSDSINAYAADQDRTYEDIWIISAGGDETVNENSEILGHGLFTYSLLTAIITGSDADGDSFVTVSELYAEIFEIQTALNKESMYFHKVKEKHLPHITGGPEDAVFLIQ